MRYEADALDFNPWGDDDSHYRVLDNRMVVTRYPHDCAICFELIPAGERIRAQREVYDGKAMTFRFCALCCRAMVIARRRGDIWPMEKRTALGILNAESKRGASGDAGRSAPRRED